MFEILDEQPAHFVAHNGKAEFRIAKKMLTPQRVEHFQKLFKGGKVKKMAEGGEVGQPEKPQEEEHASGWGIAEKIHKLLPNALSARPAVEAKREQLRKLDEQTRSEAHGGLIPGYAEGDVVGGPSPFGSPDAAFRARLEEQSLAGAQSGATWAMPSGPDVGGGGFQVPSWALSGDPRGNVIAPAPPPPEAPPAPPPGLELAPSHAAPPPMLAAHEPLPVQAATQPPPASAAGATGFAATGYPGMSGFIGQMKANERLQETGIQHEAQARGRAAQEQTQALDTYSQSLKEHQTATQQHFEALQREHDSIVQDIQNSHIDPNRMWSNKSSGEKAGAILGMVLGGIGSGLTGQPNAALHVIQTQIDRDIDAQKMDIGKKQSLLSDNYHQTGNLFQAEQLTRLQMSAVLEGQLRASATRVGGAEAQARAEQAIAAARQSLIGPMMQAAQFQAMSGMISGGEGGHYVPSQANRPMPSEFSLKGVSEMRKDANERRVHLPDVGAGAYTYAPTKEEAAASNKSFASMNNLQRQAVKLGNLAQVHGAAIHMPGSSARAEYESTASSLITELNQLQQLNRLNENEYKEFGNMIPTEREWLSGQGAAKIRNLQSLIQMKRMGEYQQKLGLDSRLFAPKTEKKIR